MTRIELIKAKDREVSGADATTGMVRETAVSQDGVWAGLVRTAPQRPSGWHHHGDYDTYFYVQSGKIRMEFGPNGTEAIVAEPGDFVHVPKRLIHREVNPDDRDGAVVLVRVGNGPPVTNVDGPPTD